MATAAEIQEEKASPPAPAPLPAELAAQLNGALQGQAIAGWSAFNVDEANRFISRFAVLADDDLLILEEGRVQRIPVADIDEAKIVEDLGVDRMRIIAGGKLAAELRYTRQHRNSMTRLQRKLQRRLKTAPDADDRSMQWLEAVEREKETAEICAKCGAGIPAYAEGVCPRCIRKRAVLWRLMEIAKPYRKLIALALALTLLQAAASVLPPIMQRNLVDTAIDPLHAPQSIGDRVHNLLVWSAGFLLAVLFGEFIGGWRLRILSNMGTDVARDLRHRVYAHMHTLSLRFFAKRRVGSLITRVTNDTDRLWDFIVFGSVSMVRDVLMIIVMAIVMFWVHWQLAIVAIVPLPFLALVTYHRSKTMQWMFSRLWTYWSRMTAVVGDALPGVRVVKAFSNEGREVTRFDARSDEYSAKEREVNFIWTTLQPMISATMRIGTLLVWVIGGYLLIKYPGNGNTLGTLLMFVAFLSQFYTPIMELANSNRMVTRAASSAQRVFEVLDTSPEIHSPRNAVGAGPDKPAFRGEVEFRHVGFSYEGTQPALRDVSLLIEPGQMIGLCGSSGAGKSTLVNLLCRFYDVTDGQILVDGVDVRDYDVQWLRKQIGVVLQEPYLFHGTLADNIRYGNTDASADAIIAAARAANAHDFIVGFPDGYDTMVGERGQSLSGGERQRISIARAILHNPRVLILDEATSSVDSETERQIQEALDRLVEGRTTIAIAHRLSTLQAADKLVVLEKGKIVEEGAHAELVDKPEGVYAKLHKTQVEASAMVAIK